MSQHTGTLPQPISGDAMSHVRKAQDALDDLAKEGSKQCRTVAQSGRDVFVAVNLAILWLMLILCLIGIFVVDRDHPPQKLLQRVDAVEARSTDHATSLQLLRERMRIDDLREADDKEKLADIERRLQMLERLPK